MTGDIAVAPPEAGLSVVIPCFNEVDNVEPVYREIVRELAGCELELLFVDDGSTDQTLDVVKRLADSDARVQYISFTRNFGFEAAFSAGYRYARRPWVLHVDADQQFPAAEALKLVDAAHAGYDAVFGVRVNRDDPALRRWASAAFYAVTRRMLGIEIPKGASAFRLVRTELARAVVDLRLGTPYFLATVPQLTSRYTTVAVEHRPRLRGKSKARFGQLAGHGVELLAGFTSRLAVVASAAALAAAGLAVLLAAASAVGMVAGPGAAAASFALLAVVLLASSLTGRYLVAVGAGQARPRLFYVRESSFAVDEADLLFSGPAAGTSRLAETAA